MVTNKKTLNLHPKSCFACTLCICTHTCGIRFYTDTCTVLNIAISDVIFHENFHNFAIDFVTICKKRFPSSLRNIAPSGRPSPPGMRHVLAPFPHDLVLLQSPILHCMLYFAHLLQCAEAKIEGRRCCSPQKAFNKSAEALCLRACRDSQQPSGPLPTPNPPSL